MIRTRELESAVPLVWSVGTGVEVWSLFSAAVAGDLPTVRRLIAENPGLVRAQYRYRTPLYFAVRENRVAVAEFLLDRGADPLGLAVFDSLLDICGDRGYDEMARLLDSKLATLHNASARGEPIAAAIRGHELPRVLALLDADPGLLTVGDRRGNQPIHWAVMTRQLDVIDGLVARGADLGARRQDGARPIHLTNGDYHYRGWRDVPAGTATTPAQVLEHLARLGASIDLNTAAYTGDIARVRELLAQDRSLANRPSDYGGYYLGGGTPLRNAAATGQRAIVELLLAHGADPNLPEEGIAPNGHGLYSAAAGGHHEIARMLLEHGAYPSPAVESSADALSRALMNGDGAMVDLLCSYGSARSVDIMAYYGDVETVAAVLHADPRLADNPEALENAATEGQVSMIRLLLRYRPELAGRVGLAGKTAEITEILFAHGMNPSHPDWLGITPLHRFAAAGDLDHARLFVAHGANLVARDEDCSSTPLGWAAKAGRLEMVKLLLDLGAPRSTPDDPAWATPLAWARRRGHGAIADLLAGA